MDQQLAAVHAAFAWQRQFGRLVLLGAGNLAQVLPAGQSRLLLKKGGRTVCVFPCSTQAVCVWQDWMALSVDSSLSGVAPLPCSPQD